LTSDSVRRDADGAFCCKTVIAPSEKSARKDFAGQFAAQTALGCGFAK
jgi:hypothetical protein